MDTIEVIYILAAIVAIGACIPQIRQLIVSKASDELSIPTWSMWLGTQCITLAYVLTLGNFLMAAVSLAWVSFYASMVVLIVYYRRPVEPVELAVSTAEKDSA